MKPKVLGILGGVGPLASIYFQQQIVKFTDAETDQEHIPAVIYNDTFIPDRTAYILGKSELDPLPYIEDGFKKLEKAGCDLAVITCNTAHFFFDRFSSDSEIPIISIIDTAVEYAIKKSPSVKKIGVIATDGTVQSGVYKKVIEKNGFECVTPDEEDQRAVMNIIYNEVKAGKKGDCDRLMRVVNALRDKGCGSIILGCTELSVMNEDNRLTENNQDIVDAMEALAKKCIVLCGKKIKE